MGLDDSMFGAVKSNLLSQDPLPSLDVAYQVVIQDEESKRAPRMMEERHDGVSFTVQTSFWARPQIELRGRNGHVAAHCFQKFGYPSRWGRRPRYSLNNSIQELCTSANVDRRVSGSQPPPARHLEPARAHQVTASTPSFAVNFIITDADRVGFSGLIHFL